MTTIKLINMKNVTFIIWIFVVLCAGCGSSTSVVQDEVSMTKKQLADKVKGGWAAKTIGCTYGGPVEFLHNGTMIQDYTPIKWSKDRVKYYYDTFPGLYDDIYVDIVFVNVFDRLGLEAPADSFAVSFADAGFPLWHANQVAKYNIKQGIMPPMSGHWLNNPHADDIDYQIEADFAGLMSPGMPNTASEISDKIGHIFTYVWGIERSVFSMVGKNGQKVLKTKGFRHGRENGLNISKRFFSLHGLTSALRLRGFSSDIRGIALHRACRWG